MKIPITGLKEGTELRMRTIKWAKSLHPMVRLPIWVTFHIVGIAIIILSVPILVLISMVKDYKDLFDE